MNDFCLICPILSLTTELKVSGGQDRRILQTAILPQPQTVSLDSFGRESRLEKPTPDPQQKCHIARVLLDERHRPDAASQRHINQYEIEPFSGLIINDGRVIDEGVVADLAHRRLVRVLLRRG